MTKKNYSIAVRLIEEDSGIEVNVRFDTQASSLTRAMKEVEKYVDSLQSTTKEKES